MKAAGWRIGSEKRPGMVKKGHEALPGPIYEIPSKMVEGPRCHMHAITDKVDQNLKRSSDLVIYDSSCCVTRKMYLEIGNRGLKL